MFWIMLAGLGVVITGVVFGIYLTDVRGRGERVAMRDAAAWRAVRNDPITLHEQVNDWLAEDWGHRA